MPIFLRPMRSPHHALSLDPEHEEQLISLFSGVGESARVARIDRALSRAIGCGATVVMITRVALQKIIGKHSEINISDIAALQNGVNCGYVQKDKSRHLVFFYPDRMESRNSSSPYLVVFITAFMVRSILNGIGLSPAG